MPRSTRIQSAGAFYHVMARGNRRARIFVQDADRTLFLPTLGEACERTGWRVHAWVLMSNHRGGGARDKWRPGVLGEHLLLETPEPNLVVGMQWLQNTYTRRFNTRHHEWGRLFGDRYKAVIVEGEGYYYETALDYSHLNPVRAGLVEVDAALGLLAYPWSSVAAGYALPPSRRPPWLEAAAGLAADGRADTTAGRRAWVERLERRAREERGPSCGVPSPPTEDSRRSTLQRGWYWGSQAFSEKLLRLQETLRRPADGSRARATGEQRAHGEAEAERLLREGLASAGLDLAACPELPGSDSRKVERGSGVREEWHYLKGVLGILLALSAIFAPISPD